MKYVVIGYDVSPGAGASCLIIKHHESVTTVHTKF